MRLFCPMEQLLIEWEEPCGGYEDTNQKGDHVSIRVIGLSGVQFSL